MVDSVLISGDTALFIGWLHKDSGPGYQRLFAFKPPGPVVDITEPVFEFGVRQQAGNRTAMLKTASIGTLKEGQEGVEVGVASEDWGDPIIRLSWRDVLDIA